jgi:hypothetical protein
MHCTVFFRNLLKTRYFLMTAVLLGSGEYLCAEQAGPSAASTTARTCSMNPVLTPSGKKGARKTKHPLPPEPPPACIEVKGETLEIQEALQAVVRDLRWRVHENHATEDSWSFVRYLNVDELEKYADTKVLVEPVDFEDGKTAVVVRTVDIGGGFVRVQISARFEGEGKSADTVMKQPATSWPLNSKGLLEKELIDALLVHYKHLG